MGYYLKKQGLSGRVVYWIGEDKSTGETRNIWSDVSSDKKIFSSEESIQALNKNEDAKNGGFSGAQIVSE